MIKRVIFDQDDTLVSWTEENWNTLNEAFLELSYELKEEEKQAIIKCIDNYEKEYSMYVKEDMYEYINKELNTILPHNWIDTWLDKLSVRNSLLEPNIKEILDYLKEKYELVVLTNWFSISQINILKKLGIYHYFDEFVGTDEVLNKPNSEAFIKACGNKKLEECIMIGDNFKTDIIGAYNAGMEAIWYNRKQKQAAEKIKVMKIKDLLDLKKYL